MYDMSIFLGGCVGQRALYTIRQGGSCYDGRAGFYPHRTNRWPPVTSPPTLQSWFTIEVDDGVVHDIRLLQDEG